MPLMASEIPIVQTSKLAAKEEEDGIARAIVEWVNKCPEIPDPVEWIQYEFLPEKTAAMALSAIQGVRITRQYITGGHQGQYQFKVIYRLKADNSSDRRLEADERLNRLGSWAAATPPDLGKNIYNPKIVVNDRAALFATYDDGTEDHQITMTLTYEVK